MKEILDRLEENTQVTKALQEQVAEHSRVIAEHTRAIRDLYRLVSALGARWGLLSEEAFRLAMADLLQGFGGRVEEWVSYNEEGLVYGQPSPVEVDLVVRDGEHILVEVKSSVSRGDVYEFWRVAQFYERKTGIKPRLVIVSPSVDSRAQQAAERLGIKVLSGAEGV
ncbi:PD-(D/E)XK nuclease family protein [Infirmifilum lucidum]|uniref:PD-(D/E)XK nuclease family protein n=1 Tax=Infirmifilum lucidum TaxID=2776706 RepID=UPI001CECE540|nr:DUF3782 domain-containing protein [Infirmifilum lucidum]